MLVSAGLGVPPLALPVPSLALAAGLRDWANIVAGDAGTPAPPAASAPVLAPVPAVPLRPEASPKTSDLAAPATASLTLLWGPPPLAVAACLARVERVCGVAMRPVASRSRWAHAGLAMDMSCHAWP